MRQIRNGLIALVLLATTLAWMNPNILEDVGLQKSDADRVLNAYKQRRSNLIVEVEGRVLSELVQLKDDALYQRFRVELENNHPLEVWHNIDVSMPVPVSANAWVRMRGEYDWTPQGGKLHWTHRDPEGRREGGWIEVGGDRYY
ncbi:MAG: DUF3465 domain-containing protein [Xanthomonadales bacterium]|nr:DUF3465 domain-containing protein [Xanthomonadales bacterium]